MPRSRRDVVRRSALGISAVAGCLGFGGTSDEIDVVLENADDTTHRLSVTVSFDRSTLLDETVSLAADESARHTIENPETAGSATVVAELNGSGRAHTEVRVGPGTGIRSVFVTVDADGGPVGLRRSNLSDVPFCCMRGVGVTWGAPTRTAFGRDRDGLVHRRGFGPGRLHRSPSRQFISVRRNRGP